MHFLGRYQRKGKRARQRAVRQLAYFFIPLQQPLNVEDGAVCAFADYLDPESLSLDTFVDEFGFMRTRAVSLRFHQISQIGPNSGFVAAMKAVAKAFPNGEQLIKGNGTSTEMVSITTIVEAALPVEKEDQESLSQAFDHAIECIRMVQLGYAKVTGEPIRQTSRLQMPWAVPLAMRHYRHRERQPTWPTKEQLRLFLTNLHDPFLKGNAIARHSMQHDFSDIMHATRVAYEGPFARAHQLIEKATSFADDDNTVGTVLLGAAGEMLILDIVISLLWEQGVDPRDASAKVLTGRNHTQTAAHLLRGPMRDALGEAWHIIGDEGVSEFVSEVMALRNRTMHHGEEPSDDQIRQAFQANRKFLERVELALIERLERFPLTVATLVSHERLESSGKLSELDEVLEEAPRPLDNWSAYSVYRFEVMRPNTRCGIGANGTLRGSVVSSHVAVLTHPDGKERWWLVDEDARVACPALTPALTRRQRVSLRKIRRRQPEFELESHGAFATRLDGLETSPRFEPATWYRQGEVWPMCRWDRYPTWPLPHPLVLDE